MTEHHVHPAEPDSVGPRTLTAALEGAAAEDGAAVLFLRPDAPPVDRAGFLARRDRVAAGLAALGVTPGAAVAIHLTTSVDMVAVLFAVHRLGAVAAMSDPNNTARELAAIRCRSGAVLTVSDTTGAGEPGTIGTAELVASTAPVPAPARITPDTVATIVFTSGTTAEPKGVPYTHGHHVFGADVYATLLRLTQDSRLMHHFPLFHMNGLNQMGAALSVGCEVLLVERFRSGRFDALLDEFAPTATFLNGTHIHMIRATGTAPATPVPLRRVGMALQMADADYDWFEERYGRILVEGYGQTESITMCLANPARDGCRGTCGLPVAGYRIRVVPDDGTDASTDDSGELQIRCNSRFGIMSGYLDDPQATADAFADGWLRTGDVVRVDDGFVTYVDRLKDIIKRAGENISAREVESVLERHPAVAEVAVLGRPDAVRVEVPVAFVVPVEGSEVDLDTELRTFCEGELARHKIPEEFLVTDRLPRTAVGKIEKKVLRARLTDGTR